MDKTHSTDSWSIDYSVEKKYVSISTKDYHVDPLKLSPDELLSMLQILDLVDKPIQTSTDLKDAILAHLHSAFSLNGSSYFFFFPSGQEQSLHSPVVVNFLSGHSFVQVAWEFATPS